MELFLLFLVYWTRSNNRGWEEFNSTGNCNSSGSVVELKARKSNQIPLLVSISADILISDAE